MLSPTGPKGPHFGTQTKSNKGVQGVRPHTPPPQHRPQRSTFVYSKSQQAPKVHILNSKPNRPHRSTLWYSKSNRVQSVKVKDGDIDDMFRGTPSNRKLTCPLNTLINRFHPTFIFTAEISENELHSSTLPINYKGERLKKEIYP